LPVIAAVYPAYDAYKYAGFTKVLPATLMQTYTGYHPDAKTMNWDHPIKVATMVLVAFVGHKVFNRIGVNRYVKKATLGYLTL